MTTLTIILVVALLLIAALLVLIAVQPTDFKVSRSLPISAPAYVLFEQVDDLHLWDAWSPWVRIEPDVQKTFEGPRSGVGAGYTWVGNKTGAGRMTTIECRPNELLRFDLHFDKPFKADNIAEFTFVPQDNQTLVTWSMSGKNNFAAKAFGLVLNCDKIIGTEFEKGLQNLKDVVEKPL